MNHSATIAVPEKNNHLGNFTRWIIGSLFFLITIAVILFVFGQDIVLSFDEDLPKNHGKTLPYYFDLLRLIAIELLWCSLLLAIALLLFRNPGLQSPYQKLEGLMVDRQKQFVRSVILLAALMIISIALIVLQRFPNSSDEYVYLYQANTLSQGDLWEQAHAFEKSFAFNHIAVKDGIMVGRFPIGWPMIMALFIMIGIPAALVNPILSIVTLFIFYKLADKLYGQQVAGWSLLLLAASGFFLFNSASFFSHTSCLLETLLFVYCVYRYQEKNELKYALLAGFTLGLIMLIRYYTAVLLFLPLFVLQLHGHRWKSFRLFIPMGFGALPCLFVFFWYNYQVTGNPITPVTVWGYQNEALGFVNGHTPWQGLNHIFRRFMMFTYWSSPVLLVLYFVYLFRKIRSKEDRITRPEDYFFIVFILGYFLYYEIGGNQYGPRFYYEAFPFLILFVVRKVVSDRSYIPKLFLFAALTVMLLKISFISYREHGIVDERQDVYDLVEDKGISHAVVLISSGTGVIRPMPTGDLTRNDVTFEGDVLYALDKPQYNDQLMAYYKDRRFYRYMREPGRPQGILVKLR